jgi:hypothetical protein
MKSPVTAQLINQAHQLYCQLTGQSLSLGFDRERMWFELLRLGYGLPQIQTVLRYLQREIREGRRNVGALKLSNFLQPDRFEEDLNISRVRLQTQKPPPPQPLPPDPKVQLQGRKRALECLQKLKAQLNDRSPEASAKSSPSQSDKNAYFGTDEFEKTPTH